MVTLLGDKPTADTTAAPKSVIEGRQRWVTKYLNSRFLRLPEQVTIEVRDQHQIKKDDQASRLFSDEALTAAAMTRIRVNASLAKIIRQKLGR